VHQQLYTRQGNFSFHLIVSSLPKLDLKITDKSKHPITVPSTLARRCRLLGNFCEAVLVAPFRSAFMRPTWQKVVLLVEGTLLTRGPRTVTAALRAVGLQGERHFNLFHHVLSRARWSPLLISRLLLLLLIRTFVPPGGAIEMVIDETVERRWGPHILKCGYYHDPVRSSEKHNLRGSV
jgi:DDE superfamily endonuclease